jgi:hypothetical protein
VEKVGTSNTGIVQQAIRLRCFRKHKLKGPKGKEEAYIVLSLEKATSKQCIEK